MRRWQHVTRPATSDHLPATLSYEPSQLYEQNHLVYRLRKGLGSSHAYETLMRPWPRSRGGIFGATRFRLVKFAASREIHRIEHETACLWSKQKAIGNKSDLRCATIIVTQRLHDGIDEILVSYLTFSPFIPWTLTGKKDHEDFSVRSRRRLLGSTFYAASDLSSLYFRKNRK